MSAIVVYQRNMLVYGHDQDCEHMIQHIPTCYPAMMIDHTLVDIYDILFFGKADLVDVLYPLMMAVSERRGTMNETLTPLAENIPGFSILLRGRDELWHYRDSHWQPVKRSETLILGTPDIDPQVGTALRANTIVSPYLVLQDLVRSGKLGRLDFQVKAMR